MRGLYGEAHGKMVRCRSTVVQIEKLRREGLLSYHKKIMGKFGYGNGELWRLISGAPHDEGVIVNSQ